MERRKKNHKNTDGYGFRTFKSNPVRIGLHGTKSWHIPKWDVWVYFSRRVLGVTETCFSYLQIANGKKKVNKFEVIRVKRKSSSSFPEASDVQSVPGLSPELASVFFIWISNGNKNIKLTDFSGPWRELNIEANYRESIAMWCFLHIVQPRLKCLNQHAESSVELNIKTARSTQSRRVAFILKVKVVFGSV